jgi:excisionase family DNA binding protein
MSELLSIYEAAKNLGVSPKTVRRLVAAGGLTAYRVGPRLVRIKAADLELAQRRIPTVTKKVNL